MRTLIKPNDDAKSVFETCISKVRNPALQTRLQGVSNLVEAAAAEYDLQGENKNWFIIPEHSSVGLVSADEMKKVYTSRMVGSKSPGYAIYIKLRTSTELCPYCAQRPVSQLDHYLPKDKFPSLAVTPYNLVPSCSDCNKTKLADVANNEESQTLHPYYDDVTDEQWLYARVIEEELPTIEFFIQPPNEWTQPLKGRVAFHFQSFELADLYTSQVGVELSNIQNQIRQLHKRAGTKAVQEHLKEAADSRFENHKNSWQTAMYQALAASEWYCSGGFGEV